MLKISRMEIRSSSSEEYSRPIKNINYEVFYTIDLFAYSNNYDFKERTLKDNVHVENKPKEILISSILCDNKTIERLNIINIVSETVIQNSFIGYDLKTGNEVEICSCPEDKYIFLHFYNHQDKNKLLKRHEKWMTIDKLSLTSSITEFKSISKIDTVISSCFSTIILDLCFLLYLIM